MLNILFLNVYLPPRPKHMTENIMRQFESKVLLQIFPSDSFEYVYNKTKNDQKCIFEELHYQYIANPVDHSKG